MRGPTDNSLIVPILSFFINSFIFTFMIKGFIALLRRISYRYLFSSNKCIMHKGILISDMSRSRRSTVEEEYFRDRDICTCRTLSGKQREGVLHFTLAGPFPLHVVEEKRSQEGKYPPTSRPHNLAPLLHPFPMH